MLPPLAPQSTTPPLSHTVSLLPHTQPLPQHLLHSRACHSTHFLVTAVDLDEQPKVDLKGLFKRQNWQDQ
jgi:hypothetical protein